ncbi:LmeA family phospholipid-binding protein [Nocardia fusca]|uniref:LmeA family phospholipid-binding protein n=1 Tax=Nocardia fusca TaxID=941183 RepID=UPI0007A754D5|nr:LmeA family phospholipid-binding protein [Nocardia fusca]
MRKLIIGLLCLAGLAVVVDFGAAAYSEYRVSRSLKVGADLSADPEVTFHGFPFLRQALDGRYDNIEIKADSVRPDIPGEIGLEATLLGMNLPLGDLVDGRVRNVPVEQVDVRMRVAPTELGRLFGIPDLEVHSRPADKSDGTGGSGGSGMTTAGALVLTGTLPSAPSGQQGASFAGERVSIAADLLLDGDQVRIVATGLYSEEISPVPSEPVVDDADIPAVLAMFTRTIDTKELPFGIRPTEVTALGGHIVVEGRGRDVTIDLNRLRRP